MTWILTLKKYHSKQEIIIESSYNSAGFLFKIKFLETEQKSQVDSNKTIVRTQKCDFLDFLMRIL